MVLLSLLLLAELRLGLQPGYSMNDIDTAIEKAALLYHPPVNKEVTPIFLSFLSARVVVLEHHARIDQTRITRYKWEVSVYERLVNEWRQPGHPNNMQGG